MSRTPTKEQNMKDQSGEVVGFKVRVLWWAIRFLIVDLVCLWSGQF